MPFVITRSCCNDSSCVAVCPVNCIHPTPDEPDFATSEMLYIDPTACIDCGACVPACPVSAIVADFDLADEDAAYTELNARYFLEPGHSDYPGAQYDASRPPVHVTEPEPLRVAVVGSGPGGCYAAEELLGRRGLQAQVDVFERLPVPWGLVRFGVAPDHQDTKAVIQQFARTASRNGISFNLNVSVGDDVTHEELLDHYHAVVYAVGAGTDQRLVIPGEDLPGSHAARDFVAWYNGHPDFTHHEFDLSHDRAVVIGNGNVALDVARILASDIDHLAKTDIADHALDALAASAVQEIVVLGRRGPIHAAFTTPELLSIGQRDDFDVHVDAPELDGEADSWTLTGFKVKVLQDLAGRQAKARKRIVLRFLQSPVEILGDERVRGLSVVRNALVTMPDGSSTAQATNVLEDIECGLVLRSVGYRGLPLPGVPFDEQRGVLPNDRGRVLDPETREPVVGVYTAGWIKRGPSGVIGTNKKCSRETVDAIVDDYLAGRLSRQLKPRETLREIIGGRQEDVMAYQDWLTLDRHEVAAGRAHNRPRVKVVEREKAFALVRGDLPVDG